MAKAPKKKTVVITGGMGSKSNSGGSKTKTKPKSVAKKVYEAGVKTILTPVFGAVGAAAGMAKYADKYFGTENKTIFPTASTTASRVVKKKK
jgi:hypothetical protein